MSDLDLYDTDILAWSERQADLLRRHAAGDLVNDAELDWLNIAEEIADLGSERVASVESLLIQALVHDLKAEAWPGSRDVPKWRNDAQLFRRLARRRYVASMKRKIDVADLYAEALGSLPGLMDGLPPLPVPDVCLETLEELLGV